MQEKNREMTAFLKIFWGTVGIVLVAGILVITAVGLPSPSVEVKKKLSIEQLIGK